MSHRKTSPGFTLIELLVCLTIVGIVGVIVLAQFRERREEKLAGAAGVIMTELIAVQDQAIDAGKPQIARFDSSSHRLQVSQSPDVSVASVNFDGQSAIAFDELGTPYSYCAATRKLSPLSSGSVVVRCRGAQITVRVLPITGQLQVQ